MDKYFIRGIYNPGNMADEVFIARQVGQKVEMAQIIWEELPASVAAVPAISFRNGMAELDVQVSGMESDSQRNNATISQLKERVKYLESLIGEVLPSALKKRDV